MSKLVDSIMIPAPCPVPWESMQGSGSVRDCSQCSRKVYDLSAMTETEAEKFLMKHGNSECVTFFQRHDGSIMTQHCPAAIRGIWTGTRRVAALITSLCTSLMIAGKSSAQLGMQVHNDEQRKSTPNGNSPKNTDLNNQKANYSQTNDLAEPTSDAKPAGTVEGYVPTEQKNGLTEASFLDQATRVVGLMGHPPKESVKRKEWSQPSYRDKQSKIALQQYNLANHFRKENKLRKSIEHYKRALEICKHLNSCGNTQLIIEQELQEVEYRRYYK
jgi:hypothetical protein